MEPSFRALLDRLDRLSDQFRELREGVQKAIRIADEDPEMALTCARKVLEHVVRDVYQRRCNEPPGSRPLENLIQRLVKDGYFPDRLDAYATTVRKLGNVGTHTFGETITAADVYQSLTQLTPILEWYFEVERPEAAGGPAVQAPPQPMKERPPSAPPESRVTVVPKGLRSFDANDADFFLDLLPGPRDRNGLPESIRFWKHGIEEKEEPTFSVGVIYGPSGCGKSSLVKAGLLPKLCRPHCVRLRRGDRRRHRGPAAGGVAAALPRPGRRPRSDRRHRRRAAGGRPGATAGKSSSSWTSSSNGCTPGAGGQPRTGAGAPAMRRRARPVHRPGARRFLAGPEPVPERPAHRT